jgi:hypothetical protein
MTRVPYVGWDQEKFPNRHCWNIVSGGESRKELTEDDFIPGAPVIAINRAIDIRDRLPVDIWAFWDDPNRLGQLGYGKYAHHPLTIWLGANRFLEFFLAGCGRIRRPEWERDLDPRVGFRAMDRGLLHDKIKNGPRAGFTLIYVAEKCFALGAKKLRVLSCDMTGGWYPHAGLDEGQSVEKEKWKRWEYEKTKIVELKQVLMREGVEIEFLPIDPVGDVEDPSSGAVIRV